MILKLTRQEVERIGDFLRKNADWDSVYMEVPDAAAASAPPGPAGPLTQAPTPRPPQARLLDSVSVVAP